MWYSKHRKKALEEWAIGNTTFSFMIKFGEMDVKEFFDVIEKFPSVYAWGYNVSSALHSLSKRQEINFLKGAFRARLTGQFQV